VSVTLLELAARHLGPLASEVVFVGGATVELWISDEAAPDVRPTIDVDVIVDVATRGALARFEERLRAIGFREDQASGVICRWLRPGSELVLDVMPTDPSVFGFASVWQRNAVPHAVAVTLPSGAEIAVVSPPYLLATKLEAFASRGRSDFLGSRDFADVVALVDGRPELVAEVLESSPGLRHYLADQLTLHRDHPRFTTGVAGGLPGDVASQRRVAAVVLPRIDKIIGGR
jgi:hypothetical protein